MRTQSTQPTPVRARPRRLAVALTILALAAALPACKSAKTAAPTRPPAQAPTTTTSVAPAPSESTSDRGDRLQRPRPIGALAPEVTPALPR